MAHVFSGLTVLFLLTFWGCSSASSDDGTDPDVVSDIALGDSDQPELPGEDRSSADTASSDASFYAYMAVHLDPGTPATVGGEPGHTRPERYFPTLAELVDAADEGGHELTIMFSAQWASYVAAPACVIPDDGDADGSYEYDGAELGSCLALARAWEAHGHEIAMHHHPKDVPATWDGFSNDDSGGPGSLGDLNDLMEYVNAIPVGGAGSVISATTEEFPTAGGGFRFTAARGPTAYVDADDRGDLASTPCAWSEDGHDVWRFRMRSFTSQRIHPTVTNDEVPSALADLANSPDGPYTLGFVSHVKDVADSRLSDYTDLFSLLSVSGIRLERLRDVAAHYSWTAGDPGDDAGAHACPPDEMLEHR